MGLIKNIQAKNLLNRELANNWCITDDCMGSLENLVDFVNDKCDSPIMGICRTDVVNIENDGMNCGNMDNEEERHLQSLYIRYVKIFVIRYHINLKHLSKEAVHNLTEIAIKAYCHGKKRRNELNKLNFGEC